MSFRIRYYHKSTAQPPPQPNPSPNPDPDPTAKQGTPRTILQKLAGCFRLGVRLEAGRVDGHLASLGAADGHVVAWWWFEVVV